MIGPNVFGDFRLGLWAIENSSLTDKLKHVLPRLRPVAPVTDIFLPESATLSDKSVVRANEFYASLYAIPSGRSATRFADEVCEKHSKLGLGAIELNIELPDSMIATYVNDAVARVRFHKPKVPLRINIAPFKAQFLPKLLFAADLNLYAIEQAYRGNMESVVPADHCWRDLVDWAVPSDKASVQYPVMCAFQKGAPRTLTLPFADRYRGSLYSDDLLLDSGLLA